MKLEIHLLQSFPPANLNRDENGMPKTTQFGGKPRARISSQCQKRSARLYYQDLKALDSQHEAQRSRGWLEELTKALTAKGFTTSSADMVARLALGVFGVKFDGDKPETNMILFLGRTEIEAIAALLAERRVEVEEAASGKKPELPKDLSKGIEKLLVDQAKPGDVALFGRMMAALPVLNVDASVQVAHAIGVSALQQEFDFFTAVDDLKISSDLGADHMGEVGFNSACFYRYACLDTRQLMRNLGSAANDAPAIARAFVDAFIKAVPSGHQNGFAAHTRPAVVLLVCRRDQPFSLVDAFEKPVRSSEGRSVLEQAVARLDAHWDETQRMYGAGGIEGVGLCLRESLRDQLKALAPRVEPSLDALIEARMAEAFNMAGAR